MFTKKIKIAFLISYLPKQGPVQVIFDIVKNIDFSAFDVTIITFKGESENSVLGQFKNLPVKIVNLNKTGKLNILDSYRKLKLFIKTNKIKIVHSHCFSSLVLNKFLNDAKSVHTIHIYPGLQTIAMKGYFIGSVMNFLTKQLIRSLESPIACSDSVKNELKLGDGIMVNYIQNGVSPLVRPTMTKSDLLKSLNLNPNFKYFISVGRFSKEKNFSFLIERFMQMNLKDYKLIVLGEGPLYKQMVSVIDESIILPGFRDNVSDYLFAADYYISSSLTEGMPLSVLEAMSAGLPLLLSDILPHKEILKKASTRDVGFTYSCDIDNDFNDKIKKILDMNYSSLQENVVSVYNDNFSDVKMSNAYQELYSKLISER
ncbi:MAG: glycosyltransferase involved in cell wall biosynthesis [Flavobacteriales bacterium]|jgi:glycosyltransferase involved in cell wall biosynthesis